MNRLVLLPPAAALVLALAACGGDDKDKEALSKACPAAPAAMATAPTLPGKFPEAQGVTYTGVEKDGPSTIATGYLPDAIGPAHDAYVQAVGNASGYSVTKEEQDVADAEVNFSGAGNTGQVKLVQTCKDRTEVTITIRPA
jgi:hypothetical protein